MIILKRVTSVISNIIIDDYRTDNQWINITRQVISVFHYRMWTMNYGESIFQSFLYLKTYSIYKFIVFQNV